MGTDGAAIELCRDRALSVDCSRWNATGTESRAPSALARGPWFWRLRGRSGDATGTAASPVWWFWSSGRASARDATYGQIPDVNGDGIADVVFVENDTRDPMELDGGTINAPSIVLYRGRRDSMPVAEVLRPTSVALLGSGFIADVDGDGYGDLVVGGIATGGSALELRVGVFRGGESGLSLTPQWIESPDARPSGFGLLHFPVGDTDGDGRMEVALCSPGDLRMLVGRGRCHVYSGSPDGLDARPRMTIDTPMFGEHPTFSPLQRLTAKGDVNGDGFADLVATSDQWIGARQVEERAFLFLGARTGLPLAPTQTIVAPTIPSSFGVDLSPLGDLDGDGALELVLSAPSESPGRSVYVFRGSPGGVQTPASQVLAEGGAELWWRSARALGDVTGDGIADAWIGEIRSEMGTSNSMISAFIHVGAPTGISATGTVFSTRTRAPWSLDRDELVGTGDANGDGIFDIFDAARSRICFGRNTGVPDRCIAAPASANTNRNLVSAMF
jgi:hypothetical protein